MLFPPRSSTGFMTRGSHESRGCPAPSERSIAFDAPPKLSSLQALSISVQETQAEEIQLATYIFGINVLSDQMNRTARAAQA